MPSYKTHSVHGETTIKKADLIVDVDIEAFKSFCMGPDLFVATPSKVFDFQHKKNVKEYFEYLLYIIKKNKLYNNPEIMAFVYGQVEHYILDVTYHPYIYYVTEQLPQKHLIPGHGLVEMWIDDYISTKYKVKDFYYSKLGIKTKSLKQLINKVYYKVFGHMEAHNISLGIFEMAVFENIIRSNVIGIVPSVTKALNIGDIVYHKNSTLAKPFLNEEHSIWLHPETGEERTDSFEDLWEKAIDATLEAFSNVNDYLFRGKKFVNKYISRNISYDTGINCNEIQTLKYVKNYK